MWGARKERCIWTAWGWGADSPLCTFTLKIDTCPIFDRLNLCYLQSRECRISTFQLSAWAEQAMESAQPLPLNPRIKALVVICKLWGVGRIKLTSWLDGQQCILSTCHVLLPSNISAGSWNRDVFNLKNSRDFLKVILCCISILLEMERLVCRVCKTE